MFYVFIAPLKPRKWLRRPEKRYFYWIDAVANEIHTLQLESQPTHMAKASLIDTYRAIIHIMGVG